MNLDWSRFWLVLLDEDRACGGSSASACSSPRSSRPSSGTRGSASGSRGSTHGAIVLATGVGLVSPLCSCGIVPLVISLIYGGVPLAPVFALLITSPLMSLDAFVITLGGLGPTLAWGKLASAVFAGLAGGYAVLGMQRLGWIREEGLLGRERPDIREKCLDDAAPDDPRRGLEVPERRLWYFGLMVKDMTWIIGRFLVPAIVLEAAIVAFVPLGWMKALRDGARPGRGARRRARRHPGAAAADRRGAAAARPARAGARGRRRRWRCWSRGR